MKKVLLTGASGFIGRHAIPALLSKGYEVHAVSGKTVTPSLSANGYWHQTDLLNPSQLEGLLKEVRPSHLLHFAWYTTPSKYWTSEVNLDWVKASLSLLQHFAANGGKRAVIAGTCAEYDWNNGWCNEQSTSLTPNTLYGTCKKAVYQITEAYARQIGMSWAWGRIFFLYGPYEYPQRLVPSVIQSILRKETARCSLGTQIRDFLHVEDVADAFAALLDSELQGAINIASGQELSLKEVIYKIGIKLNALENIHFGALPSAASDAPRIAADVKRLFNELNWSPKYTLDEGLNQTIEWWKANSV